MLIDLSAASILREAINIFSKARSLGVRVPTHVNMKFRNQLATPQYRDALNLSEVDPEKLGQVIGNKHRWDQGLCKFFTLHFLKYFMTRTPARSRFNPENLILQYSIPYPENPPLLAYEPSRYASQFVMYGPTLFLNNNRYLTIKIKTMYPNVTKGLGEFQLKWINMRYSKNLKNGNVTLLPLPEFKAKRKTVGKRFETRGQIRDQEGSIANFSYCQIANSFKEICHIALTLLVGGDTDQYVGGRSFLPFDLVNLLEKRNSKFRVVTYVPELVSLPLFGDSSERIEESDAVESEYRINGSEVFFIYGAESSIRELLDKGISSAYIRETFNLAGHNLYADIVPGQPMVGVLFRADRPYDTEYKGIAVWEEPTDLTDYEILDEYQVIETFGV